MPIIAVTGIVTILLAGFFYWLSTDYQKDEGQQREAGAGHDSSAAEEQQYNPCARLSGVVDSINCILRVAQGDRDTQRAEYDLQAQQDMARWALGLLVLSGVGLAVTTAGVIYVALTFRETRRMVGEASRSNAAAEAATAISRDTLELMRQTTQTELRPYLVLTFAGAIQLASGMPVRATVTVKNVGKTPAYKVAIRERTIFGKNPLGDRITIDHVPPPQTEIPVGPDVSIPIHMKSDNTLSAPILDAIKKDVMAYYFCVFINYRDSFGNEWVTNGIFMNNRYEDSAAPGLVVMRDTHEST